MNRPISAGKKGDSTTGPLGDFTSMSLSFPIWKSPLTTAHITIRIQCNGVQIYSAWNRVGHTVGAQHMGVDVVGTDLGGGCGPTCEPKQEKVSEIYKGLHKASFLPSGYLWGHL